jgi:excinuclease ABC subunit B
MYPKAPFELVAPYAPTGDQPEAIEALVRGLEEGRRFQTLEGVTGSGKTFTMANVIARWGRPTVVISHNKTLAAQLYAELKGFFPRNAVEYFVSYYDYYQPEAYIPTTDTYIEKDASINEAIERLRLAATDALLNRTDVIIVASVSCIYGLGSPEDYREMTLRLEPGSPMSRDTLLERLVAMQYTRNDTDPPPGSFRVRGDVVDVFPSYRAEQVRIEFWGDRIDSLRVLDPVSGHALREPRSVVLSPARHFVMPMEKVRDAIASIRAELEERLQWFIAQGKFLEAQRLKMRTEYDLEMLQEVGYCSGIENYARHLAGRGPGSRPACLLDYFPKEFLTIIDESHVTIPQLRGMYNGDRARKLTLVEHGFRLPSALDNRPLNFEEFLSVTGPIIFTSATPGEFELSVSGPPVRQLIRPTGIVDPEILVRPLARQVDDVMEEIRAAAARGERVLVTTLTKRTAEDLADYLRTAGLRVRYLHSEIDAIERVEILRGLRRADFDCLVGINLLREGLDLPEVSLVAILDADKEGFLRSETSLIQTAGRAARHTHGRVILYADQVTDSMRRMIERTNERRAIQLEYNRRHGITPRAIQKAVQESLVVREEATRVVSSVVREAGEDYDVQRVIEELEEEMFEAAEALEYERAAMLRDQIRELKARAKGGEARGHLVASVQAAAPTATVPSRPPRRRRKGT